MNETKQLLEPGCYFDGAHGYEFNAKRVIELAQAYGMVHPPLTTLPKWEEDEASDPHLEALTDDEHNAQDYLDQFAPEGHWVGWHEGDFGVWPTEEENAYKVTAWDDADNMYYIGTSKGEAEAHLAKRTAAGQGARLYSCYDDGNTSMSEWEIQDWNCDLDTGILTPADTSPLGEPRTCRELQGEEYTLIQNEQDLTDVAEHIDWPGLKNHTFVEKTALTAAIVAIGDGEYTDIWGCVDVAPYALSATYYRLL